MDRRAFIGTLTGGLLAAPLAAAAQQAANVERVSAMPLRRHTGDGDADNGRD
jgi:ABC-type phosphate/phosphonate transport system permease subunit